VSVEDQRRAEERIPHLLATPAAVRFLSCEPLLGPVDLWHMDEDAGAMRGPAVVRSGGMTSSTAHGPPEGYDDSYPGIDWVIVGGESGGGARPFDLAWARSLVAQCRAASVACFVKQLGARAGTAGEPTGNFRTHPETGKRQYERTVDLLRLRDRKGGDPAEWPEDLRVREFPERRP
jgi:protein gp37